MLEGTRQLAGEWWATFGTYQGWLVIRLHPPGDVFIDTPGLAEAIWEEIAHTPYRRVALEMQDVAFLPSSLMGIGVRLHKRLAMEGGELRVVGLRDQCREAWHACRLEMVIPVYSELTGATD